MQALYDFLPVLAFFGTYSVAKNIFLATAVLIGATVVQVGVQWFRTRTVSRIALISAALVLVFGGITLALHDALYIMWKPTVLYVLFALALLASQAFTPKPLVQRLLEAQIAADARTWRTANLAWAAFFLVLALVNYAFVHGFTHSAAGSDEQKSWESAWATWKLATIGVVLVFALAQGFWLTRRAEVLAADAPGAAGPPEG
jgi:intracellular septation protein